jgi:hypothetical protein
MTEPERLLRLILLYLQNNRRLLCKSNYLVLNLQDKRRVLSLF